MDAMFNQYVLPFLTWIGSLLTKAEWSAVLWLVFGTLFFTHITKVLWRLSPIKGDHRAGLINLSAGIIGGILGFNLWPAVGVVPWWIAGPVAGGGGAILTWKLAWPLFSTFMPGVAAKVNADRRMVDTGPPGGYERRGGGNG